MATVEELEQRVARIEQAARNFKTNFERSNQSLDVEIGPGSTGQIAFANSVRIFIQTILEPAD